MYSFLSGNFFGATIASINVQNSPGATVIVASQVGNRFVTSNFPVTISASDRPFALA